MPTSKSAPPLAEILEKKARDLQRVINETLRLQREITEHLSRLRHAGDASAPNKKR